VLVVVYSSDGEVLLLQRRAPFAFWQSVTGSLETGESHGDAAARELFEETGLAAGASLEYSGNLRIFDIDPRWRHRYVAGITQNTEYEWRCRVAARIAVRLDADEHVDACWPPIEAAIKRVWSWTNREALESLRAML